MNEGKNIVIVADEWVAVSMSRKRERVVRLVVHVMDNKIMREAIDFGLQSAASRVQQEKMVWQEEGANDKGKGKKERIANGIRNERGGSWERERDAKERCERD